MFEVLTIQVIAGVQIRYYLHHGIPAGDMNWSQLSRFFMAPDQFHLFQLV